MITYERLCRWPSAFRSLTGHSIAQFEALFADFERAHGQCCAARTTTKRHGQPRQRAFGGGRKPRDDRRTRLLVVLIWARIYPTLEVLGFLFSLNKTSVHDIVHDLLDTLAAMADFPFERPAAQRQKLGSVAAVMAAFPDVRLVIRSEERRVGKECRL